MRNEDLLEEIRMVRKDIQELQKEFYLFKGKAFGFIAVLSIIGSIITDYIKSRI